MTDEDNARIGLRIFQAVAITAIMLTLELLDWLPH